jgi:hypothetical protein
MIRASFVGPKRITKKIDKDWLKEKGRKEGGSRVENSCENLPLKGVESRWQEFPPCRKTKESRCGIPEGLG